MVACLACATSARHPHRRTDPIEPPLFLRRLQRCHSLSHLHQVHAQILKRHPCPSAFAWNVVMRAYALNDCPNDGVDLFCCMVRRGVAPDNFTFPFVIKACSAASALNKGKEVHARAAKAGFASDICVQNTLLDMYLKCGSLEDAWMLFDKMCARNVVSWTTMVSGMVACGELEAAHGVFDLMPERNVVSWTAMIHGHVRNGRPQDAFELFQLMQLEGVRPNEFTLVSLLVACVQLGSAELGSWIHEYAWKSGFEMNAYLGTALIDMYSKCGRIEEAVKLFEEMPERSLATWNTMITSLGVHGRGRDALRVFREMEGANVKPDEITFVGALCACLQANLVEEGCELFMSMSKVYGVEPILQHCRCIIELLDRSNLLKETNYLEPLGPDVDAGVTFPTTSNLNCNLELDTVVYRQLNEVDLSR